jgi:hypothetical protein
VHDATPQHRIGDDARTVELDDDGRVTEPAQVRALA